MYTPVWSVLDQAGTQTMMTSVFGSGSRLGGYEVIKKRLLASYYLMNFSEGMALDLNVKTSDPVTAVGLASLTKAAVLYRRINATPTEKMALENTVVDTAQDMLLIHFRMDDQRFGSLIKTDLFAAVTR